ncbi:hypothetical protein [Arenimonas daejeonensis]|uniref:hypothetical protein n=1 Tax=Arenimonas daejeonensis TaxID=370777 RepID=UPI0011BE2170|nr:hypothetical protein [Arenimonas daejeonensis]
MYLGWIVFPTPGAYLFYYDNFPASTGLLAPATTLTGAILLMLLAASAWWSRHRLPLYALGVMWFLLAHVITSSYLPLELVFEHRNYFAVLGVLLAVFALADLGLRRLPSRSLRTILGFVLIAGLAGLGMLRSATWGSSLHLAMELAQNNPGSPRASTNLADNYLLMATSGQDTLFLQMAEKEYERAAAIPGASPIPEQGLVILSARRGMPAKPEWWDGIITKLETQPIGPQEMSVVTSLLDLRNQDMPIDDTRLADAYIVLARRMTLPPTQYFAFGLHALVKLGDTRLASQFFELAVDHSGGAPGLAGELAAHLRSEGYPDAASAMDAYALRQTAITAGTPEGERKK